MCETLINNFERQYSFLTLSGLSISDAVSSGAAKEHSSFLR